MQGAGDISGITRDKKKERSLENSTIFSEEVRS